MSTDALQITPNRTFALLLCYYWFLLFFLRGDLEIARFSLLYFLFVAPVGVYVALHAQWILLARYQPGALILLAYGLLVGSISAARQDWGTATSVGLFAAVLIIVLNARITVSLPLVNTLFLLSIVGSVITYYAGTNQFGFLPGQSQEAGLEWRVSLFPLRTESPFFAAVVLLLNGFYNHARSRYVLMSLAMYFILLSAMRTIVLALLAIAVFLLMSRLWPLRPAWNYKAVFAMAVLMFLVLAHASLFLPMGLDLGSEFLNQYVLRSAAGATSSEEVATTVYRTWLWGHHLAIFLQSPLFGMGSFELGDIVIWELVEGGTGSESFVTGLLARIGLLALPLFLFFYRILQIAVDTGSRYLYSICLLFGMAALGFGSFIVPYNFVFLLMAAQMNMHGRSEPATEWAEPRLRAA